VAYQERHTASHGGGRGGLWLVLSALAVGLAVAIILLVLYSGVGGLGQGY